MRRLLHLALLSFTLVGATSRPAAAQAPRPDELRVLRFQPAGLAEPLDSVVVAFDHPVAPRLDQSVDPSSVLRIEPAVRTTAYWRDPSTIVVRFDQPLEFGSSHRVAFASGLRSADGVRIASGQNRELRVRAPRALKLVPSITRGVADQLQRPLIVVEAPVPLTAIHATLILSDCQWGSIPLTPESIRQVSSDDPLDIRQSGAWNRDRRLDSLRRVVRFVASRAVPAGCYVGAQVLLDAGGPTVQLAGFKMQPAFGVRDVRCMDTPCQRGALLIAFTRSVAGVQVVRHVRIDGKPARLAPYLDLQGHFTDWQLAQSASPGRETVVEIDGSLTDDGGEPLGASDRRVLKAIHALPSVEFTTGPVVVPRDASVAFTLRHVNTDSIVVTLGRVHDSLRAEAITRRANDYRTGEWRMEADSVVRVVATPAPLDSERVIVVPASWIPRRWSAEPALMLRARPLHPATTEVARRRPYAILQRTTFAAHVLAHRGTVDVWVTELRGGDAVADAQLRVIGVHGRTLARGVTDARGRARLTYATRDTTDAGQTAELLEVERSGARLLLAIPDDSPSAPAGDESADAPYGSRVGGDIADGRTLHGAAFVDRGIYRPGEHVYLKGMVRISGPVAGFETPSGDSARWTISYSDQDEMEQLARTPAKLTTFGTSESGFDVPRTAALGEYAATLAIATRDGWRVAARTTFRVAEYRPVEFEVALDADTSAVLFAGDTARIQARARYLFDLPMQGGVLHWRASVEENDPWSIHLASLDGFTVGRPWWWWRAAHERTQMAALDSATLGVDGGVALAAAVPSIAFMSTMTVSAVVEDANRQTVTAQRQITVHAADAYVGIRSAVQSWVWKSGEPVPLELLVVRANGVRRPGSSVSLLALRYDWIGGERRADTVWRAHAVSGNDPVKAAFTPTTPGWYELVASVRDEKGRVSESGISIWVSGSVTALRARDSTAVMVTTDRERYSPGDIVTAVVESPGERLAWITLSTSIPLFETQIALHRGPNVVRIPVPTAAMPSAQLDVIAIERVGKELAAPRLRFSHAEQTIPVSAASRALTVQVTPEHARYEPGDTVTLAVQVRDAAGRGQRAETTIWAVDQGVAALTDLEKPELLDQLVTPVTTPTYQSTLEAPVLGLPPDLGAWQRMQIHIRGVSSSRIPARMELESVVVTAYGTSPAPGVAVRSVFATTPYWAGALVTDESGRATTRFVLPHNVTTFRLFATAITSGTEVGSGDTSIVSTRPLLVRAALPRIVRLGDTLLAGGVVTQDSPDRTPVRLAVEANGIAVDGPTALGDTLDGRRARELRFAMRVTASDSVTVTLRGGSDARGDAVRSTLPVSPPGHPRAYVVMGTLEGRVDLTLPRLDGVDGERSTVALQLGVSPAGLLRRFATALRIYPYYCTEQVTSAARVLIGQYALRRAMGSNGLESRDRVQLERAVSIIVSRQRTDGSIGYWSASSWSGPWLTAYAVGMLLDARELGIEVPQSPLTRAAAYLARLQPESSGPEMWSTRDSLSRTHDALAAARLLRRLGSPSAPLERWASTHAASLDPVDRLDLALLLAERGDSAEARVLVGQAWRAARVEGRKISFDDSLLSGGWLFPSRVRAAARLFAATAALEPRHPLLGALFESVIQLEKSRSRWGWNTLEQSEAAQAIIAARGAFTASGGRTVTVRRADGAVLATSHTDGASGDSLSFTLAALGGATNDPSVPRLELEADSRAPLYYAATLFETPIARPVRADDEGISVERWYEPYTGGKPIVSARAGDLVRVRLRITLPTDREFVAVADPLPAGLEAVDLSLRTSSSLAPFPGAPRRSANDGDAVPNYGRWYYGSWDAGWWTPWEHREIRDDRVLYFARQLWKGSFEISYVARATTAGVFVRPPAHAEEMYNPAVHGRSDGGWFTVTSTR